MAYDLCDVLESLVFRTSQSPSLDRLESVRYGC
jgi:hypothetical protein